MFETVNPELVVKPSRKILYESLPLSIAAHAVVAAAVALGYIAKVSFPTQPPKLMISYLLLAQAAAVPLPPPPPPAKAAAPAAPKVQTAPPRPNEIVAPTVIPDEIPVVAPAPATPEPAPQPTTNVQTADAGGGGAEGSGDGVGGVEGGVAGGISGGVRGGLLMNDGRVHFDRQATLPMLSLRYEWPIYPERLRLKRKEGDVILRYVVGVDGAVKSVTVLEPSEDKDFDEAALKAIRRWRFHPLRHQGELREVVHEILVQYRLQ